MVMTNVNTLQMAMSGSDSLDIFICDPGEWKWHVNGSCTWPHTGHGAHEKVRLQTVPGSQMKEENPESAWQRQMS